MNASRKRQGSPKLTQDFKKKKKKVGKVKKPAENVTNVTFKSRSVVLPSQLNPSGPGEPTTHRKLTLQDLLSHISHYKPSIRKDALIGLYDLFQAHPHLLPPNLAKLVSQVLGLIVDDSPKVRQALHTLLKYVFSSTTPEALQPFFSILVAHLSCGLTHINDQIQVDTLKVFDLVLTQYPSLLVPHSQSLLPLLVALISRRQKIAQSEAGNSKRSKSLLGSVETAMGQQQRKKRASILTDNPGSKLAELSSRLQIFTLLSSFIEALLVSFEKVEDSSKSQSTPTVDVANGSVYTTKEGGEIEQISDTLCDFTDPIPHVQVIQYHGIVLPSNIHPEEQTIEGQSIFPCDLSFIQTLISLCVENWVECSPSDLFTQSLPEKNQIIPLMEAALNLLCLVLKLVRQVDQERRDTSHQVTGGKSSLMEVLVKRNWNEFQTHFISHFPFFSNPTSALNSTHYTMNFTLCHFIALLAEAQTQSLSSNSSHRSQIIASITLACNFFQSLSDCDLSVMSSQVMLSSVQIAVQVLPLLLWSCGDVRVSEEVQRNMVHGVMSLYRACHDLSLSKRLLIRCFSELSENVLTHGRYSTIVQSDLLLPWTQSLPDLFVQLGTSSPETSSLVIDSIAAAVRQRQAGMVMTTLEQQIASLLSSSSVLSQLSPLTQGKAVELVWYLPLASLSGSTLAAFAQCVSCGEFDKSVACYLVQVVHHKFMYQGSLSTISQYISFMLSVLIGYSRSELEEKSQRATSSSHETDTKDIKNRAKVIKVVCDCLVSTPFSNEVLHLIEPTLCALCSTFQLPHNAVMGILNLGCRLIPHSENGVLENLVPVFGRMCFSSLISKEEEVEEGEQLEVAECVKLTQEMCARSQPVLQVVLEEFQTQMTSSTGHLVVEGFIKFLQLPFADSVLKDQTVMHIKDHCTLIEDVRLKTELEKLLGSFYTHSD